MSLSEIYYHLGLLYKLTDRKQESVSYLEKALEEPPTAFLRNEIQKLLEQ